MIAVNEWLENYLCALQNNFGERLWFVGLQGSYARGEATASSDLDVVVILDELLPADIGVYGAMLDTMPHRDLVCGFVSGKEELLSWEPSDLLAFYYDTKPILGTLDAILPKLDEDAVKRAIKIGACNLYHGCVHNMICEKNEDVLRDLYKSASFVLSALAFHQTGEYMRSYKELLDVLDEQARRILESFLHLRCGGTVDFVRMSEDLFIYAQRQIQDIE